MVPLVTGKVEVTLPLRAVVRVAQRARRQVERVSLLLWSVARLGLVDRVTREPRVVNVHCERVVPVVLTDLERSLGIRGVCFHP